VDVTLVKPAIVVAVAPKEIAVEPIVTELFANFALVTFAFSILTVVTASFAIVNVVAPVTSPV